MGILVKSILVDLFLKYKIILINFEYQNSMGCLLGFGKVQLEPNKTHISANPVEILETNAIRKECNIIPGAHINNRKACMLHEFFPTVAASFKINEVP